MGAPAHHHGALLGAAAGVLFGVSDVALKALTGAAGDGLLALLASPWLPSPRSPPRSRSSPRRAASRRATRSRSSRRTSTAANLTCIVGGILVFGDALAGGILLAVQLAAFALVAARRAVTPAATGSRRP